eukprot:3847755-Karenia_brevis.AAC.1
MSCQERALAICAGKGRSGPTTQSARGRKDHSHGNGCTSALAARWGYYMTSKGSMIFSSRTEPARWQRPRKGNAWNEPVSSCE